MESSVIAHGAELPQSENDFASSKLGTKEYWEDAYARELQVYKDIGDVGEIWFGEESMKRARHGFSNLTGVDYSKAAIELTENILEVQGLNNVTVQMEDFLNLSTEMKSFDVCIDKGTFDAISLSPEDREEAKKRYVASLRTVMRPNSFFIITSCNWTKEQLLQIFKHGLELVHELPTPLFQFGGVTGNTVTALVFKRVD
ncbi:hypothetical protein DNTS_034403 [Danionella cerebrum]|uniref:EEF1A lysine methyltransferase 2 n=1 Tax=Danionella cerebrum TaxID=2873325 RepID=A0A553MQC4_9TELE|nr:hypothetical protein DNTS_034403 [Danionella translucida]